MELFKPTAFVMLFVASAMLAYAAVPAANGWATRLMHDRKPARPEIPSLLFRLVWRVIDPLAPRFRGIAWASYRAKALLLLQRAGLADAVTVDHLLAMKAIMAVVLPLVVNRLFPLLDRPALLALCVIGAFYLPDRLIVDLQKKRGRAILRELPGAVDLLSLQVEAGLDFLQALQRIAVRATAGPLREELTIILSEIHNLGRSCSDALRSFALRVDIPEVSSFVSVLRQADMLGSPIGPVLRQHAERMRIERFQRAQKRGATASNKILLPLVFCMVPAVLIILLGPAALQFVYGR